MSPPQLPADRPIALLAEPIEIALRVALGQDLHAAVGHGVHRRLREVVHLHEPLIGQVRLDRRLASGPNAAARSRGLRIFRIEQAQRLPDRPPPRSRALCDRQPAVRARPLSLSVPSALRMLIIGKLLPLADFVVVRVVRRRDLHAAAAQFRLGPFVGDERNLAVQSAAASACGRAAPCRAA